MTDPDEELTVLPALMSYRDTAPHAFVPPAVASVEAAAHRRRHRRIGVVTAVAVLVVGAASAGAAIYLPRQVPPLTYPTPAPTTTPSPSPSPSPLPPRPVGIEETLLTPEDLGPGYTVAQDELGDWDLEYFTQLCPAYKHKKYPGPPSTNSEGRERGLNGPKHVVQRVDRSDAARAQWEMDDTRRWVGDCASFSDLGMLYTMHIVTTGFAGDDSIMVRANGNYWIYVRKGALLSRIGFDQAHTLEEMTGIAVKAAARMR